MIEQQIHDAIAGAKIRLRFDKVVRRLAEDFQERLAGSVPEGQALLITCTAPIKLPGKTRDALLELLQGEFRTAEIHGNRVSARRVECASPWAPKVLFLVHNDPEDAGVVLDLAESTLREA